MKKKHFKTIVRVAARFSFWWGVVAALYSLLTWGGVGAPSVLLGPVLSGVMVFAALLPAHVLLVWLMQAGKRWWMYVLSPVLSVIVWVVLMLIGWVFVLFAPVLLAPLQGSFYVISALVGVLNVLVVVLYSVFAVNVVEHVQQAASARVPFDMKLFWMNALLASLIAYIVSLGLIGLA